MSEEITTTEDDLAWMSDANDMENVIRDLYANGFHDWPSYVPAPLDGYTFEFYGPMLFSKPKCSLWHRLRYRLFR